MLCFLSFILLFVPPVNKPPPGPFEIPRRRRRWSCHRRSTTAGNTPARRNRFLVLPESTTPGVFSQKPHHPPAVNGGTGKTPRPAAKTRIRQTTEYRKEARAFGHTRPRPPVPPVS